MIGTLHSKVKQNPLQSPSRLIGLHLLHTPCDKIHPTDSEFSFASTFGCILSIVVPAENFADYTQEGNIKPPLTFELFTGVLSLFSQSSSQQFQHTVSQSFTFLTQTLSNALC